MTIVRRYCAYLLTVALLWAFSSCVDIERGQEQELVSFTAVSRPATKAPMNTGELPVTRTIRMAAWHNASAIGGSSQNYFPASACTYNNTSSKWECAGRWWPLEGTLSLLAYSIDPSLVTNVNWGSTNYASQVRMTIADNSTVQDDIVFAARDAATKTSNTLEFKHAQAWVTFGFSGVTYDNANNLGITIQNVTLNNAYYGGQLLAVRNGDNVTFDWYNLSAQKSMTFANEASWGAGIMLPVQTAIPTFTVNYTLHNGKDVAGNPINTVLAYTHTPSDNWAAGYKYVYTISFTEAIVQVTASLAQWVDDPNNPHTVNL